MATISTEGWPVQILPFKSAKRFPISLSGHMVLIFKDDTGREYQINAGPHLKSFPFGQLDLRDIGSPLNKRFNVVDGSLVDAAWRGNTRVDFGGRDPAQVWEILLQHARNIHRADIPYDALHVNSNTVIAALLDVVGVDVSRFLPDPRGVMLRSYIGANGEINFDYSLTGTDGDDFLRGRAGRQTFEGMDGNDRLIGGDGGDRLIGGSGRDVLLGGSGHDSLAGGTGSDTLIGGDGNDLLRGGRGADRLEGGIGRDTLLGMAGDDRLEGGHGDDRLEGGAGNDRLEGEGGNDVLRGDAGDDVLSGGAGADSLVGGDGNDRLRGGSGHDTLRGGAGADRLLGDAGADTFVFRDLSDSGLGADADTIVGFQVGQDVIDLAGLAANLAFAAAGLTGAGPSFTLEEVGGDTRVKIDVDGDGRADMQIALKHVLGLGVDEFIF